MDKRYQYWHIILKSYDDRFPEGDCISNKHKMDYRAYEIFNMSTGKSKIVCEVDYIGRTLTNMPKEEKILKLKEMKEQWKYKSNSELKPPKKEVV